MKLSPAQMLEKYPESLPRYTSYPPANHFRPGTGKALLTDLLQAVDEAHSLSLYIHVPFCDRLCWFCGCHTKHTLRYDPIQAYVQTLLKEIRLWGKKFRSQPTVSRLHFGGGSPSLLTDDDLQALKASLDETFTFLPDSEISFEIDPSDMKERNVDALARFGMNRASIGVQDFDALVQKAINRPQTFDETARVVGMLRNAGVSSLNIDALYGLPLQTTFRLRNTLDKVLSLKPDRIALFGYAHVPWLKSHQKMIRDEDLPDSQQRFHDATWAGQHIRDAGYKAIGIDHFALPADALAIAASNGNLHRNFQGYTDDATEVMLPLGASSIGGFSGGLLQNEPATGVYTTKINAGELALSRGLVRSEADQIRGWMIERLMCDYSIRFDDLRKRYGPAAESHVIFAKSIASQDDDGLCESDADTFTVMPDARTFVRVVASRFDQWLSLAPRQYSKAV